MNVTAQHLTTQEIAEIIKLVTEVHEFDFSDYSTASFKRRLIRLMLLKRLDLPELKELLATSGDFFREFLEEITVNVTEMFRDPSFYKALYHQVLPSLLVYPQIKVWSPGCSTGEEVYSLAILMHLAGIQEKALIDGTDVNISVLKGAQNGMYSFRNLQTYIQNYQSTGLPGLLTDYFTIAGQRAEIKEYLKRYTQFYQHNLISEAAISKFQLITCRNVFIYFETSLQEKVLDLFYDSLSPNGFLCLGSKETIRIAPFKSKFRPVNQKENIYQKIGL